MAKASITTLFMILISTCFGQKINGNDVSQYLTKIELGFDEGFNLNLDKSAKLIMNGELHNIYSNHIIKFQLLRQLYTNNQVRYLII